MGDARYFSPDGFIWLQPHGNSLSYIRSLPVAQCFNEGHFGDEAADLMGDVTLSSRQQL